MEDRLIDGLSILTGGYNDGYPANPSIRAEVFTQDVRNTIDLAGSGPDGSYIQGYDEKNPPTAGRVRLSPQGTMFINQKDDVFVSFLSVLTLSQHFKLDDLTLTLSPLDATS